MRSSIIISFVVFVFVLESCSGFETYQEYVLDGVLRLLHAITPSSPKRVITKREIDDELRPEDSKGDLTAPSKETVEKRGSLAHLTLVDCSNLDDPLVAHDMIIKPNPVRIPGPMDVSFVMQVKENATAPLRVTLEMSKKINLLFGLSTWFEIPCLTTNIDLSVGSCTYDDLCEIPIFRDGICTSNEKGVEKCGCPISKGDFTSKPVRFELPEVPADLPPYILEGEFYVKAIVSKDDVQMTCYSASIDLDI